MFYKKIRYSLAYEFMDSLSQILHFLYTTCCRIKILLNIYEFVDIYSTHEINEN